MQKNQYIKPSYQKISIKQLNTAIKQLHNYSYPNRLNSLSSQTNQRSTQEFGREMGILDNRYINDGNGSGKLQRRRRKIFQKKFVEGCLDNGGMGNRNQMLFEEINNNYQNKSITQSSPKNKQKRPPSFARPEDLNSYQTFPNNLQITQSIYSQKIDNKLPKMLIELKQQMKEQQQQISDISKKIDDRKYESDEKQKQLFHSLVAKQSQLTKKQYELTDTISILQKINSQSHNRYKKLLQNELQLQQAKRIELIIEQNEKLYKKIIKNNTNNSYDYQSNGNYQENMINVSGFFKDGHKDISALYTPFSVDQIDEDNDENTLRDLLSPLHFQPDSDY